MRAVDLPDSIQPGAADTRAGVTAVAVTPVVRRDELAGHLSQFLDAPRFKDAALNGLQVAGRERISRIVAGVTANRALIEAAIAERADAIIVHHGLFWKGDSPALVGFHRERVAALLAHAINLYAYHLPLDAHPIVGNNACMARRLGLTISGSCGESGLVLLGQLAASDGVAGSVLAAYVARQYVGGRVMLFSHPQRAIRRIAWCTGAGGSLLGDAVAAGADAFITGEISEQHVHQARESNITLITAGHHATERDGVAALATHITQQFGVPHVFIDIHSPV